MTFAEKLRHIRVGAGMKQDDLATAINVAKRSILSCEKGEFLPRSKEVYSSLSELFEIPIEFWTTECENDLKKCIEYAEKAKDKQEINRVISDIQGLFAGGRLSENDAEKVMQAMKEAYWELKMGNPEGKS